MRLEGSSRLAAALQDEGKSEREEMDESVHIRLA